MNEKRTQPFIPALLFWTALWWLAAALFGNALLLPAPHRVFLCLLRLAATKVFWQTLALSIARILLGITSATALGILLAVVTTRSRFADALIACKTEIKLCEECQNIATGNICPVCAAKKPKAPCRSLPAAAPSSFCKRAEITEKRTAFAVLFCNSVCFLRKYAKI